MTLAPGTRLGPYEVLAPLGAGGMGEVFRARDTRLGRDVAIKVLPDHFAGDPKALRRFETEAKAVAALSHPNILSLFDVGETNGTRYAVTELLEGEPLRALVLRGPVPVKRALEIAREVAEGLAAAHEKGIVHRDVKPENVFLTRDGHAKVLDFGLARHETTFRAEEDSHSPTLSALTEAGAVVGTVAYMSPEQARGLPVDHRSDQFSLGTVLYEMLAGKRAFRGETPADTLTAIIRDEPEPLEALAPATSVPVRVLVERLLAKEPAERYDSTRDLARDLEIWGQRGGERSSASGAATAGADARVLRASRGRRVLLAAVAGLALATALGAAFYVGRRSDSSKRPVANSPGRLTQLTWEPGMEIEPCISADGGSFVYDAGPPGNRDVFFRRVGGENPVNLTHDHTGNDIRPALSPDGSTIAFRSERDGGGIFLMGASGESPRRLTDFGYDPAFSPDGKEIVFATGTAAPQGEGYRSVLWIADVATGKARKLFEGGKYPTWSPSGTRIAFEQGKGGLSLGGNWTLSTMPVSGGAPTPVVELPSTMASCPDWSLTGITFDTSVAGQTNVWRIEVDEATGSPLGEEQPVLVSPAESLRSSSTRDGRRMLFVTWEGANSIDRFDFDPAKGRLVGERETVASGPRDLRPNGLSPDGQWLATVFLERGGRKDIVLLRVGTGETRRLTDDPLPKDLLRWAPNGSKLYFCVAPEGLNEVWSIRPDGSGRQFELGAPKQGGVSPSVISPDGRTLYVDVGKEVRPHRVDLMVPPERRSVVPMPRLPDGRHFDTQELSPDGRWLVGGSRSPAGDLVRDPLYLFDVERETYAALPSMPGASVLGWLPDSRRLLLAVGGELRIVDRVTRNVSPAGSPGTGRFTAVPRLTRDGRSIYGFRQRNEGDIWMLDFGEAPDGKARPDPGS